MNDESVNDMLLDISLAMSDAFLFIKVRTQLENFQKMAENGDPMAQAFMTSFTRFHRLCRKMTQ